MRSVRSRSARFRRFKPRTDQRFVAPNGRRLGRRGAAWIGHRFLLRRRHGLLDYHPRSSQGPGLVGTERVVREVVIPAGGLAVNGAADQEVPGTRLAGLADRAEDFAYPTLSPFGCRARTGPASRPVTPHQVPAIRPPVRELTFCSAFSGVSHLRGASHVAFGLNPLMVLPCLGYAAGSCAVLGLVGRRPPNVLASPLWGWLALWAILCYWVLRNPPLCPFSLLAT